MTVYLFGAPRMMSGSRPVEVDTRKAIALLAFLALTGEDHSRDELAALLWPDYDQEHARAALRRTLSTLKKALGADPLEVNRDRIGLVSDAALWVDAVEFDRCLAECRTHGHRETEVCADCQVPLEKAAALYRGDLLAGFTLRDSPSFDDWQFFQSEATRRELASVLERLVHLYRDQGRLETAIEHAHRWLSLDPLHEPAHRQLMALNAWAGNRTAAIRQYQHCVQVLDRELGVEPLEETTRMYEAIRDNHFEPPPAVTRTETPKASAAPVEAPPQPTAQAHPLVGRETELSQLEAAYHNLRSDGFFAVLEGEAGIGKTRLAEAFIQEVRAGGAAVVQARCYEGQANLAYGPFVEALRAAIQARAPLPWWREVPASALAEAARLLPELAPLAAPAAAPQLAGHPSAPFLPDAIADSSANGLVGSSPGAQSRLFEAVRQVLLALLRPAQGAPAGVLMLDDVQWLDEASLDLLMYLVRRLQDAPIFIIVTWRSSDIPDRHRLRLLLGEARRARRAALLYLPRLSAGDVAELVRSREAAGQPAAESERLANRLYQESEGLPFFVVEYLEAFENGTLAEPDRLNEAALPGGVRDLLLSRLSGVDDMGWQILQSAAVVGRSFDFDIVRGVSGRGDEETVSTLDELVSRRLIIEQAAPQPDGMLMYDFSHEKLRSLVIEAVSPARRRLLHLRSATALETRARQEHSAPVLAARIAHHYHQAGSLPAAAGYYCQAGEYARSVYANAEALAHFEAALACGHPEAAWLNEQLGSLHTLKGEYNLALEHDQQALALYPAQDSRLPRVYRSMADIEQRRGGWQQAEKHLQAALDHLGENGDAGERAWIFSDWSLTANRLNDPIRAQSLASQALRLAEKASSQQTLAQAHNILGILARESGSLEEARRHLEQSLSLAETFDQPGAIIAACNNLALVEGSLGNTRQAVSLLEKALILCQRLGDRHREAALHNNLADLYHAEGQTEAAMAHLKKAVVIFAEIGAQAGASPEVWKLTDW